MRRISLNSLALSIHEIFRAAVLFCVGGVHEVDYVICHENWIFVVHGNPLLT